MAAGRSAADPGVFTLMYTRPHASTSREAAHFAGGADIAPTAQSTDPPTARVRSTLTVGGDRQSMTAFWERSDDGINWHPWMDISFTRSD